MNEIILGDCIDFLKKQKGKIFDVVFTSPPYNRLRNDTYAKFDDINTDYYKMLCELTENCIRLTNGNVIINVQSNMYNKKDLIKWQADFVNYYKGCVVWCKNNPTPSWNYKKEKDVYSVTNAYEYFYFFGDENSNFEANNKILNFLVTNVNTEHFEGHGAVMKLEVAEWFIQNFTKKGDFVFDPFIGCGTTAVACIHNGRRWGGVEIIPEYKEMAEKRIQFELDQHSLFDDIYQDERKEYKQLSLF